MARIESVDGGNLLATYRGQLDENTNLRRAQAPVSLFQLLAGAGQKGTKDGAGALQELMNAVAKGVGDALQQAALEAKGYVETDKVANEDIAFMTVVEGAEGKTFAIVTHDGRKLLVSQDTHPELFAQVTEAYQTALTNGDQANELEELTKQGYRKAEAGEMAPNEADYAYFDDYNYGKNKDPDIITFVKKGANGDDEKVYVSKTDAPALFDKIQQASDAWGKAHGKAVKESIPVQTQQENSQVQVEKKEGASSLFNLLAGDQERLEKLKASGYEEVDSKTPAPQFSDIASIDEMGRSVAGYTLKDGKKVMVQASTNKDHFDAIVKYKSVKDLMDRAASGGTGIQYKTLQDLGYEETDKLAGDEIGFMTVAGGVEGKSFAVATKDGRKLLVSQDKQPELFATIAKDYENALTNGDQAAEVEELTKQGYRKADAGEMAPNEADYAYFSGYNYAEKKDPDILTFVKKGANGDDEKVYVSKTDAPALFDKIKLASDAWGKAHGKSVTVEPEQDNSEVKVNNAPSLFQLLAGDPQRIKELTDKGYQEVDSQTAAPQFSDIASIDEMGRSVAGYTLKDGKKVMVQASTNKGHFEAIVQYKAVKDLMNAAAKGTGNALQLGTLKDLGYEETDKLAADEIGFMTVVEGVEGKTFAVAARDGRKLLVSQDTHAELFAQVAKHYEAALTNGEQAVEVEQLKLQGYRQADADEKAPDQDGYAYFDDYNYAEKKDPDIITFVKKGADSDDDRVYISKKDTPELFDKIKLASDAWGKAHGKTVAIPISTGSGPVPVEAPETIVLTAEESQYVENLSNDNYKEVGKDTEAPELEKIKPGSIVVHGHVASYETTDGSKFMVIQQNNKKHYDAIVQYAPSPVQAPGKPGDPVLNATRVATIMKDYTDAVLESPPQLSDIQIGSIELYGNMAAYIRNDGSKVRVHALENQAHYDQIVFYHKATAGLNKDEMAFLTTELKNRPLADSQTPVPLGTAIVPGSITVQGKVAGYETKDGKFVVTEGSHKDLFDAIVGYDKETPKHTSEEETVLQAFSKMDPSYKEVERTTPEPKPDEIVPGSIQVNGTVAAYQTKDGKFLVAKSINKDHFEAIARYARETPLTTEEKNLHDQLKALGFVEADDTAPVPKEEEIRGDTIIHIGTLVAYKTIDGKSVIVSERVNRSHYDAVVKASFPFAKNQEKIKELLASDYLLAGENDVAPPDENLIGISWQEGVAWYQFSTGKETAKVVVLESYNKPLYEKMATGFKDAEKVRTIEKLLQQRLDEQYVRAGKNDVGPSSANDMDSVGWAEGIAWYQLATKEKFVVLESDNKPLYDKISGFYKTWTARDSATDEGYGSISAETGSDVKYDDWRIASVDDENGVIKAEHLVKGKWIGIQVLQANTPVLYYALKTMHAGGSEGMALGKARADGYKLVDDKTIKSLPTFDQIAACTEDLENGLITFDTKGGYGEKKIVVSRTATPALYEQALKLAGTWAGADGAYGSDGQKAKAYDQNQLNLSTVKKVQRQSLDDGINGVIVYETYDLWKDKDGYLRQHTTYAVTREGNPNEYAQLVALSKSEYQGQILSALKDVRYNLLKEGDPAPDLDQFAKVHLNDGGDWLSFMNRGTYMGREGNASYIVSKSVSPDLYTKIKGQIDVWDEINRIRGDGDTESIKLARSDKKTPTREQISDIGHQTERQKELGIVTFKEKETGCTYVVARGINIKLYEDIVALEPGFNPYSSVSGIDYTTAVHAGYTPFTDIDEAPKLTDYKDKSWKRIPVVGDRDLLTWEDQKGKHVIMQSIAPLRYDQILKDIETLDHIEAFVREGFQKVTADAPGPWANVTKVQVEDDIASFWSDGKGYVVAKGINPTVFSQAVAIAQKNNLTPAEQQIMTGYTVLYEGAQPPKWSEIDLVNHSVIDSDGVLRYWATTQKEPQQPIAFAVSFNTAPKLYGQVQQAIKTAQAVAEAKKNHYYEAPSTNGNGGVYFEGKKGDQYFKTGKETEDGHYYFGQMQGNYPAYMPDYFTGENPSPGTDNPQPNNGSAETGSDNEYEDDGRPYLPGTRIKMHYVLPTDFGAVARTEKIDDADVILLELKNGQKFVVTKADSPDLYARLEKGITEVEDKAVEQHRSDAGVSAETSSKKLLQAKTDDGRSVGQRAYEDLIDEYKKLKDAGVIDINNMNDARARLLRAIDYEEVYWNPNIRWPNLNLQENTYDNAGSGLTPRHYIDIDKLDKLMVEVMKDKTVAADYQKWTENALNHLPNRQELAQQMDAMMSAPDYAARIRKLPEAEGNQALMDDLTTLRMLDPTLAAKYLSPVGAGDINALVDAGNHLDRVSTDVVEAGINDLYLYAAGLKASIGIPYREGGALALWMDLASEGADKARTHNLALILQALHKDGLDPSVEKNWMDKANELKLLKGKDESKWSAWFKKWGPRLGALGSAFSLFGAITLWAQGKTTTVDDRIKIAAGIVSAFGSANNHVKVVGQLQAWLGGSDIASEVGAGDGGVNGKKWLNQIKARDLFIDAPIADKQPILTTLNADSLDSAWATAYRGALKSKDVRLQLAILQRLDEVNASVDTKMAVLIEEFDPGHETHAPSAKSPKLDGIRYLLAHGLPVMVAAMDFIGGGFGLYLGANGIKKSSESGDTLGVVAGSLDAVSGAGTLAIGAMETAALFGLRATALSALAGPILWGIVSLATFASFVVNLVRSQIARERDRKDYMDLLTHVYQDGVGRSDVKLPEWLKARLRDAGYQAVTS